MNIEERLNDIESKLDYLIGLMESIMQEQDQEDYDDDDDGYRERDPLQPL